MNKKKQLIEVAKEKFLAFGSKHITMDELAALLGISKKTIYGHFSSKEELVVESINQLIKEFKNDMQPVIDSDIRPLKKIIAIYDIVFNYILKFKPSFVFGLQKYYPEAYKTYKDFTGEFVSTTIFELLKEAQHHLEIRKDIHIELFSQLYFQDLEKRLYSTDNLLDNYSKEILLEYMITNNLKGIKNMRI